ncbi:pseudouridine synthase [Novosphingobium umbonatum]|nr:pseudouridine synthase [Novosphingobium umbonatum]
MAFNKPPRSPSGPRSGKGRFGSSSRGDGPQDNNSRENDRRAPRTGGRGAPRGEEDRYGDSPRRAGGGAGDRYNGGGRSQAGPRSGGDKPRMGAPRDAQGRRIRDDGKLIDRPRGAPSHRGAPSARAERGSDAAPWATGDHRPAGRDAAPRSDRSEAPRAGSARYGSKRREEFDSAGPRPVLTRSERPAAEPRRGERSFTERAHGERFFGDSARGGASRGRFGDKRNAAPDRVSKDRGGQTSRPPKLAMAKRRNPYAKPAEPLQRLEGEGERIAKLLARAGVASRREVERLIAEGRVKQGDEVITTPAMLLTSLNGITVDGEPVQKPQAAQLYAFHKPEGLITAERDPAGRPTIYTALRNALPEGTPRLMPVGRLDLATEGLLLLTNDGELKRAMELPSSGIPRTYRARTFGDITQDQLEQLMEGIEVEGVFYGRIDANMERRTGRNQWIELTLTEGKNREVRRVLEALGLQVSRLMRTKYGPFELLDLARGQAVQIPQKMVDNFIKTLKPAPTREERQKGEGA